MSGVSGDRDPDPAALDELQRAFADDRARDVSARGRGPADHAEDAERTDHAERAGGEDGEDADEPAPLFDVPDVEGEPVRTEPFELSIVEQDPLPADEPAAPSIIRIDDFSGSVAVDPAEPTPPSLADARADDVAERPHRDPHVDPDVDPDLDPHDDPQVDPHDDPHDDPQDDRHGDPDDDPTSETPRIIVIGDATPLGDRPTEHGGTATRAATDPGVPADGIISISGDDRPDTVYVQGSLDRDGDGSIVIIEDDDTGDTLAPDAERDLRRGIEPRMRERRVQVRRTQGRRRLIRLAVVAGVALIVVGTLAVLGSSLFAVRADEVRIDGARYADPEALNDIIADAVGTPVLRLDTDDLADRIEEIPWVESATVRADFPHGLTIDIRERAAMTTYQGPDQRFRVLDREGRVLDVIDKYPFAYVLIGGPDPVDLAPGEFAPRGYAAASELAKNLTGSVRGRVTMIEVESDGSRLVMHLDDGTTVFFGEARDLLAKLVRLEAVLANGQEREPGLVDVSTADVTR